MVLRGGKGLMKGVQAVAVAPASNELVICFLVTFWVLFLLTYSHSPFRPLDFTIYRLLTIQEFRGRPSLVVPRE